MQRAGPLLLLGALCLAVGASALQGASTLGLDALEWRVSNANGTISLTTKLPAYPVNLLQKKGLIQDPLYRFGELETRWVALDTWTFTTEFTVPPTLLSRSSVDLVLNGVDTFAAVSLNDQLIANLENFHRRYLLPVKSRLRAGTNKLRITLLPAITTTIDRKMKHPYWIPTVTQLGNIDAYNFARKPAYDYGWDWGPGLGAAGIYGGISLAGYDTALLRSAHVRQVRGPTGFQLKIEPELTVPAGGDAGRLVAEIPSLGLKVEQGLEYLQAGRALGNLELLVPAGSVKLWWPVGYGEQPLYDLVVSWTSSRAPEAARGTAASTLTRRVGFRTVELVERPLAEAAAELLSAAGGGWKNSVKPGWGTRACAGLNDCGQYGWVDAKKWTFISTPMKPDLNYPVSGFDFAGAFPNSSMPGYDNPWWNQKLGVWTGWGGPELAKRVEGESMYFKVNGVPIYAKGANIIPFHTLPVNATPDLIRETVDLALDGHMNMLRVWGGGWYMPDMFYDIADEKGILIWQETMFACASYPRDSTFMAEVKAEVEQQIRRISWHPSVVIWGGNNEIEGSLEWYRETQNNAPLFVHDYTELFIATIGGLMNQLVPEIPYVDSSPSNGVISRSPYIKRWGATWDARYGDVHHYDYYADCQDFKNFPMAKFVSEHGWPSFPTWHTFKAATAPEDWAVGSPGMEFRQRHYNKTMEMTNQYSKHFKIPDTWQGANKTESYAKWRRYLYLNLVQQALCIDTAFSYWRRLRSEPNGLTMGILYWQLNDVWAGASWSGIDYEGRYKPMQYRVKHQYADFVVQAVLDGGHAQVFVVSDDMAPTTASLELTIHRLAAPSSCTAAPACAEGADAATCKAAAAKGDAASAVWRKKVTVPVPALNSALVVNASISELLSAMPGCSRDTCFLRASATTEATRYKPAQTSSADLFFKDFKNLKIAQPKVTLGGFEQEAPDRVGFSVSTDAAAALLVVLDTAVKGKFSDNMVNIAPCGTVRLSFESARGAPVSADKLKAALEVTSLWENQVDNYEVRKAEDELSELAAEAKKTAEALADAAKGVVEGVVKDVKDTVSRIVAAAVDEEEVPAKGAVKTAALWEDEEEQEGEAGAARGAAAEEEDEAPKDVAAPNKEAPSRQEEQDPVNLVLRDAGGDKRAKDKPASA